MTIAAADPLNNWRWLAALPSQRSLLILSNGDVALASVLATGFDRLEVLRLDDPSAIDELQRFQFEDGSFDCVAVTDIDALRRTARGADVSVLLARLRRVLRADGGVYIGFEQLGGRGSNAVTRALRHALGARQPSALNRAGFGRVRSFYVEPSLQRPHSLIPAVYRGVVSRERVFGGSGSRFRVRRLLIAVGLHSLLFKWALVIATV